MGITIQRDYVTHCRFRVKPQGDRRLHLAEDLGEALEAVKHYYAVKHDDERCPFCRRMAKDAAKFRRREARAKAKAERAAARGEAPQ